MEKTFHRRILDGWVRTVDRDTVCVDMFLSDGGSFFNMEMHVRFPERCIVEARMERFGLPEEAPATPSLETFPELEGIQMGAGYIGRIRNAVGNRPLPPGAMDAWVECARLIAQIDNQDPEALAGADVSNPLVLRRLDLASWPELEEGCIPYARGMEQRFSELGVRAASRLDIYAPLPGQRHRFRRDKILECRLDSGGAALRVHLSDDIHEMSVELHLSPDAARITDLQARSIRSPYPGLCNLPFERTSQLVGVPLDGDLRSRVTETLGGKTGCIHLADLVLDLIRYHKQVT